MSAVDALAVLREMHIRASESVDYSANDAREASAAIAAVAELIATLRQVRIEATESPQTDADRLAAIVAMADAALARVGGGK